MKKNLLSIAFLAIMLFPLQAQIIQSKLDFVAGLSAREYFHAGFRYQYSDITQLGISIGSDLELRTEKITTYSIDHMIHFGTLSMYTNRPAWYARQGFTYSVNLETVDRTRKFSYLNFSLGREFAVNTWLGFNADMGIIWQVKSLTIENQAEIHDNLRYIMPLARIQAFISF